MKIEFKPVSKTEIKIMGVFGRVRKEIGHIFTPSSNGKDTKQSIQVCGFSDAYTLWGCGLFGQLESTKKEKCKSPMGVFEVKTEKFRQVKDIQLRFEPKTIRHTVENASSKCLRCFNKPCTCESKNKKNPYFGVRRSNAL